MRGAAEFCLDMLVKDKNDQYVTSPGTSPENIYITDKGYKGATLYGATADLAMIKELFIDLIEATNILEGDYDFKNKLKRYWPIFIHIKLAKKVICKNGITTGKMQSHCIATSRICMAYIQELI